MERSELRSCLESRYTIDELKTKCFDANIDYQAFPTEKLESFVRELVLFCERNGRKEWLIKLCSEKGGSPSAAALREHDYATLSDCHTALFALRNVFENRLPIPQLHDRHIAQVGNLSYQVLKNPGVLKRIMGDEWAKELAETVTQVAVLDHRLAGQDILKEVKELKNRSQDEVMAFMNEHNNKRLLMGRLDRLITDLETKLK